MARVKETYTKLITEDGTERHLKDLPNIFEEFVYKVTNKRLEEAESKLLSAVMKESEKLFKLVVLNNMNTAGPDSKLNPYLPKTWSPLTKKWTYSKGHSNFWYGSDYVYKNHTLVQNVDHLRDYIAARNPSTLFGMPDIRFQRNKRARGYQKASFYINPYPLHGSDLRENWDESQYVKFFGERMTKKGYSSNERERPLLSPAIQYMIDKRIRDKAMSVIEKAMIGVNRDVR